MIHDRNGGDGGADEYPCSYRKTDQVLQQRALGWPDVSEEKKRAIIKRMADAAADPRSSIRDSSRALSALLRSAEVSLKIQEANELEQRVRELEAEQNESGDWWKSG